jgi:hypothetical protein
VNGKVLVVPIGVVTPMFLIPVVAELDTLSVALIVVEFTTVKVPGASVTPPPSPVNPVAPVKFAPLMTTGTASVPVDGCVAEFGLMEVIVAPCTVNGTVLLVPPGVVTLTLRTLRAAPVEMVKVALICVILITVTPLTATPPPETATVVAPAMKLVPVNVTATAVPRTPVGGAIEVKVGAGGTVTVKVTALLVPPGAVTVTFLAPAPVNALIVKVALTWVSLTTVKPLTVIPPPPDTLIAVVPVNPLPNRLTGTAVPREPEAGEIDVSTGPVTV